MATERKTTRKPKTTEPKAELKAEVTFVSHSLYKMKALPNAKHLVAGKVYEVSGILARELYKKGFAEIV